MGNTIHDLKRTEDKFLHKIEVTDFIAGMQSLLPGRFT